MSLGQPKERENAPDYREKIINQLVELNFSSSLKFHAFMRSGKGTHQCFEKIIMLILKTKASGF